MNTLDRMLEIAGVPVDGLSEDCTSAEDLTEATGKVKHAYDRKNKDLLITSPQNILKAVLSPVKGVPVFKRTRSALVKVKGSDVMEIRAALESQSGSDYFDAIVLYAWDVATNREHEIASFWFVNGVYHSRSGWHAKDSPSYDYPGVAEAEIDDVVARAVKFLKGYIKNTITPKVSVAGSMFEKALQANKDLGLRIPEAKLKRLFDEIGV